MRSVRPWWSLVAVALALPGVAVAHWEMARAKLSFFCSGPAGLHLEGTGNELAVSERGDALVFTVQLDTVTTGVGMRDRHMQSKYLETSKYPTAELLVPRANLKMPEDGASVEVSAPGTMSIHGVSKPVDVHYKATRHGNTYDVWGDVHIDMHDFDIETPAFLGVKVRPAVDIVVSFELSET